MLENRLIKQWQPSGNVKLKRTDRYCYLRCRLDIPYPVLEVAPEPGAGPRGQRRAARRRARWPRELADQLTSLYRLRHCGRRLKLREHPSAYGQMGRCVSPCLGDLDPNAYRRQLDQALAHFERPGAGEALIDEIDERMREAAPSARYERAAALLRRRERLAWVLERLDGVLRATHAAPRLVLARHPVKERFDAFWLVRGRLVDWGPLPGHVRAGRAHRGGARRARPGARSCRRTRSTRCGSWRAGSPSTSCRSWRSTRRRARRR